MKHSETFSNVHANDQERLETFEAGHSSALERIVKEVYGPYTFRFQKWKIYCTFRTKKGVSLSNPIQLDIIGTIKLLYNPDPFQKSLNAFNRLRRALKCLAIRVSVKLIQCLSIHKWNATVKSFLLIFNA